MTNSFVKSQPFNYLIMYPEADNVASRGETPVMVAHPRHSPRHNLAHSLLQGFFPPMGL
jgi:hypothetical protein